MNAQDLLVACRFPYRRRTVMEQSPALQLRIDGDDARRVFWVGRGVMSGKGRMMIEACVRTIGLHEIRNQDPVRRMR